MKEEIKKLAEKAIPVYPSYPELLERLSWNHYINHLRMEWAKGYETAQQVKHPVMQWVKCFDRVPTITKWYSIRNWITGNSGTYIYCDSHLSISQYCKKEKLDFEEFEWLEEL